MKHLKVCFYKYQTNEILGKMTVLRCLLIGYYKMINEAQLNF